MRILLLTNAYPPEIGGASNLCLELAQALTARGNHVVVVTRFPRHLPEDFVFQGAGKWLVKEKRPEAEIIRVNIPQFNRRIPLVRELDYLLHVLFLVWAGLKSGPIDVIMTSSPPLVMGYAAVLVRFFKKVKVVLNVQDIFPQNLIDLGVLKNKFLIVLSRFLEKDVYRRADWITVMSEGNKQIVDKASSRPDQVMVVHNWVDPDFIVPGDHQNDFRREFGLEGKFVLSFAGCIAASQDMDIILQSARLLKGHKDIVFLLAANGPGLDQTIHAAGGLDNVKMIPIQPRARYVQLLAASNAGMVTLNPAVATPTVPSKIKSIMSAGRPVLASFPLGGDAPKLIKAAKCGIVVEAGNADAFSRAILKLYQNPGLCAEYGRNGREFVLAKLTARSAAERYEEIFNRVVR